MLSANVITTHSRSSPRLGVYRRPLSKSPSATLNRLTLCRLSRTLVFLRHQKRRLREMVGGLLDAGSDSIHSGFHSQR